MKKLRVLVQFRDERNFFTIHQSGDTIEVTPERAARLIEMGLCQGMVQTKAEISDSPELEPTADEKPARVVRRKKQDMAVNLPEK